MSCLGHANFATFLCRPPLVRSSARCSNLLSDGRKLKTQFVHIFGVVVVVVVVVAGVRGWKGTERERELVGKHNYEKAQCNSISRMTHQGSFNFNFKLRPMCTAHTHSCPLPPCPSMLLSCECFHYCCRLSLQSLLCGSSCQAHRGLCVCLCVSFLPSSQFTRPCNIFPRVNMSSPHDNVSRPYSSSSHLILLSCFSFSFFTKFLICFSKPLCVCVCAQ